METFSGSSESPTVLAIKRQIADVVSERNNLRGEVKELRDLLREIADHHMLLVDKRYEGQFSTRLNKALGMEE